MSSPTQGVDAVGEKKLDASASSPKRRFFRDSPLTMLLGGALLVAVGAGLVAAHVTAFALDETLIEQSAVHYTHEFPHSLFHDLDARATDRLYSLVLSVAFRLFSGSSAVRVDHVLSVLLFVSTAIPIYLLARIVLRSRWTAVTAALLSVASPWLTLTSTLYTENLSYPLFWWMMLATSNSVWKPSIRRDALALLSIVLLVCTRAQFAAVFPGYIAALLVVGIIRSRDGALTSGRLRSAGSASLRVVRNAPLSFAALAAVLAGFLYETTSTTFQPEVERLLGTYSNVVIRNGVSSNMVEGLLIELIALALGVGLLPAIVSLVWYAKRVTRPQSDQTWVFLCASGIVLLFFLVLTVFSQGGYLGAITEERYFFYVIPVFWIGTFAALREGGVRPGELVACAVALAALYGSIPLVSPLTQETAFLAPAESVVTHVLSQRLKQFGLTGLTAQDVLALLTVTAGILVAYLWQRRSGMRRWLIAGLAVAVQGGITAYCFAVITGHINGIVGRTAGSVSSLGWVDTNAHSPEVTWIENLSVSAPMTSDASPSETQQRTTLFWNSRVRAWTTIPALGLPPVNFPMSALPGMSLEVDRRTGALTPSAAAASLREVVSATSSPFLQLEGDTVARSPDGVLALTQLARPIHADWFTEGLLPNAGIPATRRVNLIAYGDPRSSLGAEAIAVVLTFEPIARPVGVTAAPGALLGVSLGKAHARVKLLPGSQRLYARVATCVVSSAHAARGSIVAQRSPAGGVAGYLTSATVIHGGACSTLTSRADKK